MDIRLACAKVIVDGMQRGNAFLVDSHYALTTTHVIGQQESNIGKVELEFATGKYIAKVEVVNYDVNCSVLALETDVEDVIPAILGVDVTIGDAGYIYGFPPQLEGVGLAFEGKVQDITVPNTKRPSEIVLSPLRSIANDRIFIGLAGAPLVVKNLVVGILTSVYDSDFLFFRKIQDILELLPKEFVQRIRPRLIPEATRIKVGSPDILVISALDEELDYLFDFPFDWSELKAQKDGISYRRGLFADGIDIIVTSARSMGLIATSILTAKALKEWNPSVVAMIGVCGGRKEKGINLGDIIVASQCFHYQFGSFEDGKIIRELRVENTETQVIDVVEHLARRTEILTEIYQSIPRGFKKPNTMLQCHVGPMASADLVVKDIEKFGEAVEADRKTIAVDMESYAFMRAARLAKTRWAFVVKSASDFADAKKDDEYREYAKCTSSQFFVQVARSLITGWV